MNLLYNNFPDKNTIFDALYNELIWSKIEQIFTSVTTLNILRFNYNNEKVARVFMPYLVYVSTRKNVLVAGHEKQKNGQLFWKQFDLKNMEAIRTEEATFKFTYPEKFNPSLYKLSLICANPSLTEVIKSTQIALARWAN